MCFLDHCVLITTIDKDSDIHLRTISRGIPHQSSIHSFWKLPMWHSIQIQWNNEHKRYTSASVVVDLSLFAVYRKPYLRCPSGPDQSVPFTIVIIAVDIHKHFVLSVPLIHMYESAILPHLYHSITFPVANFIRRNLPMMTSSNGNIFLVTGPLWGESTGHQWIPLTRASKADLWCFLDVRLNKRLSKQSKCRWFQTPWHSLLRHCNDGIHKSMTLC